MGKGNTMFYVSPLFDVTLMFWKATRVELSTMTSIGCWPSTLPTLPFPSEYSEPIVPSKVKLLDPEIWMPATLLLYT